MSEPRRILLAGYGGREPSWLLSAAVRLDAVVFDVRHSPRSRKPEWSGKRLSALLGDRYRHVPEWGNVLYRTSAIQIADFPAGLAHFDAETRPVILLCVCRESAACHRRTVADLLTAQRGMTAVDLDNTVADDAPRQASLFGEAIS